MLALSVALVGPHFVDWTSYRADFEREATRILGRDVKVEGSATARLLPFPSVTFTDVTVAGVEPGETAVTIETFSMDAELAPFLSGEVLIFDMRLVRPVVFVDIDDKGGLDWAVRPSVPVDAHNIKLEKLTVTEGRVDIRHAASGRLHTITEFNADVSARALTGPWRLDGSMRLDGMRTTLAVSTGPVDDTGRMRLRVRADPERFPVAIEADGSAYLDNGRARYGGDFKLAGGAIGDRLRAADGATVALKDGTEPKAAPYRLSGVFDLDHDALRIPEFLFETGAVEDPYTAEGTAEFRLGVDPSFLVTADGAQIRFEDLDPSNATGIDLDRRLAAIREFLLDMPKPAIPGRIEVNLPAIVAGDTMVRDVRLYAEPSQAGWHLASLAATLPGRTTLEAKGELGVGEKLDFAGSLLLAIWQPSGFAAWLSKDVDEPIRRLPAAGFSAEVELSDERQVFRDLELVLGAARFRGEIDSLTPDGAEPSMSLTLDGDALDVEGMAAFASLFVSDAGETRLSDRNLSFEIKAGPVSAVGLMADSLDTSLRLRNDRLEIDRLSIGGLAGANVSATGVVRNPGLSPSGNLDASVIAADLLPLVGMLAERFPENPIVSEIARRATSYPDLLTDASIEFVASAVSSADGPEGVAISSTGQLGGTRFSLTGSTDGPLSGVAGTPVQLNLSASDDDAGALYALAGLPALPLGFAGTASLELAVDGALGDGAQANLAVSGDGLDGGFDGRISFGGEALSASGALNLAADDIAPWLTTAGATLPGAEYGLPVRIEAAIDADDGLLVLSNLTGKVGDSSIQGDINAQMKDGRPHLTGALAVSALDLGPIVEMAIGPLALQPGIDIWPDTPFAGSVATPVSTDIEIAAASMIVSDTVEARDAMLELRLGPGGIFLTNAHALVFGGTVSGNIDFRNDGGTGLLSGQLSLQQADPAAVLGDVGLGGTATASVTFTSNGKSIGGIVKSLAGSGTASLDGVRIEGIDPGAFPDLVTEADKAGPQIDATAVAAFAPDLVRRGSFSAASADIAFTLASGIVRAPPVRLQGDGAALTAEVGADFGDGTLSAEASLTYAPGREALIGSEPTVRLIASGPPGDIGVFVDTEPLSQFLTQRALELEQQRVEAMQASLLEKQRYRREARYYAALGVERENAAEAARINAEEAERLQRELELQEKLLRAAEEEEARRAEEEKRAAVEEDTRRRAADAEREAEQARKEADDRRQAEEARLRAQVEELLNNRPEPASNADGIVRTPLAPPPVVDVTPQPAPRAGQRQPAASPPAANAFSEQNLSIEGLMRALSDN